MLLSLGFSPCPNDTFIFDALVNRKIDAEGLEFALSLEDVQTLNQWAIAGKLDVSKVSYGVLPLIGQEYSLLDSGGALGRGVGPLLIARQPMDLDAIDQARIAIPGENTTAHVLFSMAFPKAKRKSFMLFSTIEQAVLSGEVDAGVIIHENRFTYQQKGLVKLMDLGAYWEKETGAPIPLGGIVVKKTIDPLIREKLSRLIRQSTEYAFRAYPQLSDFIRLHAQEMDESVIRQHIDLYVNEYSLGLGADGREAVNRFLAEFAAMHHSSPAFYPPVY